MAWTLANAQQLSNNKLTKFVIDEFRKSALMDKLVWDNNAKSQGGASFSYTYNRVTTLPTAAPRLINADYTAQEPVTTAVTALLGILGGSFQIDRALAANEHEVVDLVQFHVQQKAQAAIAEYCNQFINGNAGGGTGEFDGLNIFLGLNPGQVIATGVDLDSSADITTNWRTLLDLMRSARALMDKAPSIWLMNQDMYAVWNQVMDRAGINVLSKAEYGYEAAQWGPSLVMPLGDIPGTSNPIIPTAAGLTSIYGLYLGLDGVHGLAPDNGAFIKTYLPDFTASGALQTGAVEMIAGMAVKAVRSVVRLTNIDIA